MPIWVSAAILLSFVNSKIIESLSNIVVMDNEFVEQNITGRPRNKFMGHDYEDIQNTLNQLYLLDHFGIDDYQVHKQFI